MMACDVSPVAMFSSEILLSMLIQILCFLAINLVGERGDLHLGKREGFTSIGGIPTTLIEV